MMRRGPCASPPTIPLLSALVLFLMACAEAEIREGLARSRAGSR